MDRTYSYDQSPELPSSGVVDALYIATPNWRHAEFAVPALEASIHVLLEKPMEISSEECLKIISASERSGAKLMIAYRSILNPPTSRPLKKFAPGNPDTRISLVPISRRWLTPPIIEY